MNDFGLFLSVIFEPNGECKEGERRGLPVADGHRALLRRWLGRVHGDVRRFASGALSSMYSMRAKFGSMN